MEIFEGEILIYNLIYNITTNKTLLPVTYLENKASTGAQASRTK